RGPPRRSDSPRGPGRRARPPRPRSRREVSPLPPSLSLFLASGARMRSGRKMRRHPRPARRGGDMDTVQQAQSSSEERSPASQILEDGLFSGALGAVLVALWYLILDSLAGRPLYTPFLLGSVLFQGTSDVSHLT